MRQEAKRKTREPIPLNCPTPYLKVAPLRLEERTLQGPGGKQTKKPQEAPQLSRVCHRPCSRVRTAGDRGAPVWLSPWQIHSWQRAYPPGSPSAGPPSTQDTWLRVLLHRLFPDFSLTQLASTHSGFLNYSETLSVHPSTAPFKVTSTTTNRSHPPGVVGMSFIHLLSASKLTEYRVSVTHRVNEWSHQQS